MSAKASHIVCPACEAVNRVPVAASVKNFAKQIRANDIPVLVDFWAEWCGPCKMMAPIFEQVASDFEPRIRFLKVDTEAEQALAAQYNIRSIPTLILFRKGAVIAQRSGATTAQGLRSWLRQHTLNENAA